MGMQLKRKAKLPTVVGLTTKHAVEKCCNTLMLKAIFLQWEIILMTCADPETFVRGGGGGGGPGQSDKKKL